jgi:glycine cleavage system H protein
MSNEMKFAETHEWARVEDDGIVVVGISDHAQDQLGDIVFVDLPEVGNELTSKDEIAVIESVKTASDIYAPVSGTVTEVNSALDDTPELVNSSAEEKGWLFKLKIKNLEELEQLLSPEEYEKNID